MVEVKLCGGKVVWEEGVWPFRGSLVFEKGRAGKRSWREGRKGGCYSAFRERDEEEDNGNGSRGWSMKDRGDYLWHQLCHAGSVNDST
jgi:hypothetical protein